MPYLVGFNGNKPIRMLAMLITFLRLTNPEAFEDRSGFNVPINNAFVDSGKLKLACFLIMERIESNYIDPFDDHKLTTLEIIETYAQASVIFALLNADAHSGLTLVIA